MVPNDFDSLLRLPSKFTNALNSSCLTMLMLLSANRLFQRACEQGICESSFGTWSSEYCASSAGYGHGQLNTDFPWPKAAGCDLPIRFRRSGQEQVRRFLANASRHPQSWVARSKSQSERVKTLCRSAPDTNQAIIDRGNFAAVFL